jgi:hypothetical protein
MFQCTYPADVLQNYAAIELYLSTAVNQQYRSTIDWATLCEQGRAVLLIDGLGELSDEARSSVSTMIEQTHALYPALSLLIAARDSTAISLPPNFEYCCVERLGDEQLVALLKRYLSKRTGFDKATLPRDVLRHPELAALCRVPLFSALLVATLPPRGELPRGRSELLERYIGVALSPQRLSRNSRLGLEFQQIDGI